MGGEEVCVGEEGLWEVRRCVGGEEGLWEVRKCVWVRRVCGR